MGKLFEMYLRDWTVNYDEAGRMEFIEQILERFNPAEDPEIMMIFVPVNGLFVDALGCYAYGLMDACAVMLRDALDAAVLYASNYRCEPNENGKGWSWHPIVGEFAHTVTNVDLSPALKGQLNAQWGYLSAKLKEFNDLAESKGCRKINASEVEGVRKIGSFAAHLAEASIKAFGEYIRESPEELARNGLKQSTRPEEAKEAVEKTLGLLTAVKNNYATIYAADKSK